MRSIEAGSPWYLLAALTILAVLTTGAAAGDRSEVTVQTGFDNAYINVTHPGDRHLEIEVAAPEGGDYVERRSPLNLALVIDKSGSMAEAGKMDFVKEAARMMVDRLQYGDRFSIVAYDDGVRVLLRSEAVEDRHRAKRLIDGLYPGGSTNLGAGLIEGYEQVRRNYLSGGTNRVLLLSDGLANRGITSPRELSRIVHRESGRGISLTTFGVGLDFNEDLLASIAESGRGTYYYIDRPQRVPEILAREFSTLQQVVALDVIITIEVLPEVAIGDIMGYEYRRDGSRYIVRLGDLAAGERRRIMVRLKAPALSPGDHRVGEIRMRYQPQGGKGTVESSSGLRLKYVRDQEVVDRNLNRSVSERSAVFDANHARQRAAQMVDRGDLDSAREILDDTRERLEGAPVQSGAVREELAETEDYRSAINAPMSREEKSAVQKGIKYKSYRVLQSK